MRFVHVCLEVLSLTASSLCFTLKADQKRVLSVFIFLMALGSVCGYRGWYLEGNVVGVLGGYVETSVSTAHDRGSWRCFATEVFWRAWGNKPNHLSILISFC